MLRVTQIRYDANGKAFIALQGQTDEEAHEMNRKDMEMLNRAWAKALEKAYEDRP